MIEKCRKITDFFAIFDNFLNMKTLYRISIYMIIAFLAIIESGCGGCGCHRGNLETPLPLDSLFVDLGKANLERRTAMAKKAFDDIRRTQGLNGVVLYAEGGKILLEKAYGWRDLVHQRDSLRIDDQFQLASVSKMFTAEAIMLLHAQGKLNYDDDLQQYIPEFPYEGITIRHLLNHRSGLSRYETLADEHWPDRGIPISNEEVIKLYGKHQPSPYNLPDVTFHYTNINYALLASVVERVTGQPFDEFMKEQVFKPLDMDHSYIYTLNGQERLKMYMDTKVQGHDMYRKGPQRVQDDYLNGVMGDKMMYSTVEDLYKFSTALENGTFIPDSLQQEAFIPGSPEWKNGDNYGFGWRLNESHPGTVFHFGWWKGYRSFFIRDVERGRTLIALTNTDNGAMGDALWNIIDDTTVSLPAASVIER